MAERQVQPRRQQHEPGRAPLAAGQEVLGEAERQPAAGRITDQDDATRRRLPCQLPVHRVQEGIGLPVRVLRGQAVQRHLDPHPGVRQPADQRPVLR